MSVRTSLARVPSSYTAEQMAQSLSDYERASHEPRRLRHPHLRNGTKLIEIYRRADTREQARVAHAVVDDASADPREIGRMVCEAMDRELVTRAGG